MKPKTKPDKGENLKTNKSKYWDNQDETLWIHGEVILCNQNVIKWSEAY